MTCQNCGAEIPEGQTLCANCRAATQPQPQAAAPPATPETPPGPGVPQPPTQQPAYPEPQQPGQPPVYPPYPYPPTQYGWPYPPPRRAGKPVLLIIIIVFTFVGAASALMQAAVGQPGFVFGIMLTGPAGRLFYLIYGLVTAAIAVGLIFMSRWGWWAAIVECLFSALNSLLAIPRMDVMLDQALQQHPFPPPPEMMPVMQGAMAIGMIFGALLQVAIIAYLVWKRDLFGIDVQPPSATP